MWCFTLFSPAVIWTNEFPLNMPMLSPSHSSTADYFSLPVITVSAVEMNILLLLYAARYFQWLTHKCFKLITVIIRPHCTHSVPKMWLRNCYRCHTHVVCSVCLSVWQSHRCTIQKRLNWYAVWEAGFCGSKEGSRDRTNLFTTTRDDKSTVQKRVNQSRCRLGWPTHVSLRNHVLDGVQHRMNPFAAARGDKSSMQPFAKNSFGHLFRNPIQCINVCNNMQLLQLYYLVWWNQQLIKYKVYGH